MIDENDEKKKPSEYSPDDSFNEDDEVEEIEYGTDGEVHTDDSDEVNYSEYNPFDTVGEGPDENPEGAQEYSPEPAVEDEESVISGSSESPSDEGAEESGEEGMPSSQEEPVPEDTGEMENPFTEGNEEAGTSEAESLADQALSEGADSDVGTKPVGEGTDGVLSFDEHKKMAAADAEEDRPKSKPKKLNKKFLLTAIVTVFCLTFVLTFLMPSKGKKKKGEEDEERALQHGLMDYSLYAEEHEPEDDASISGHYNDGSESDRIIGKKEGKGEEEEVTIPPVVPPEDKHKAYDPNKVVYSNNVSKGGKGTLNIPDTRNDRLQGKVIAGIKGLTSTQEKYSTDYNEQIEINTASSSKPQNQLPSKEEYMNSALNMYSQAYGNASGANAYALQNDQRGKNAFFNGGNRQSAGQGKWLGLNTIWEGTIFEATLTSAINTDLPGEITARVAKNIYSSQDGRFLLIPQNSVLLGTYNSSISYAQSRVQVQWNSLIRPDGYRIELGGMNGTDPQGASGIKGHINDHPLAYLKAIALMSSVSIMNGELTNQLGNTQNQYVQNVLADTQKVANELGEKLIDRAMNVQPTITIKEGTKINIVANTTLSLPPCDSIPVTQKYMRNR